MSQLEKLFKDSLQNEQVPLDPKAWSAMESKLNQSMPVQASNAWKWVAAAVGTAAVATVAIYSSTSNTEETQAPTANNTTAPIETNVQLSEKGAAKVDQKESVAVESIDPTQTQATNSISETSDNSQNNSISDLSTQERTSFEDRVSANNYNEVVQEASTPQQTKTNPDKQPEIAALVMPTLKTVYCQNETFELFNANEADMTLKQPSGSKLKVSKGQSGKVQLTEPGKYIVTTNHPTDKRTLTFEVVQAPSVAFRRSNDYIYKDGIPYLEFETMNFSNELTWKLEGKTIGEGEAVGVTIFKQGNYDLSLEAKDEKGCISTSTQSIRVDNNYNLIAELALRPKSSNRAVNTFMPEALELRNTGFTLIIMDKGTGGTIYQTSDANQGWNGIDARTGEMVSEGVYLWKVVLNDPLPGEKNIYLGTVNVLL